MLGGPFSTGVGTGGIDAGWVGSPGVVSGGDIGEGVWDSVEALGWGMVVLEGGPGCAGLISLTHVHRYKYMYVLHVIHTDL